MSEERKRYLAVGTVRKYRPIQVFIRGASVYVRTPSFAHSWGRASSFSTGSPKCDDIRRTHRQVGAPLAAPQKLVHPGHVRHQRRRPVRRPGVAVKPAEETEITPPRLVPYSVSRPRLLYSRSFGKMRFFTPPQTQCPASCPRLLCNWNRHVRMGRDLFLQRHLHFVVLYI